MISGRVLPHQDPLEVGRREVVRDLGLVSTNWIFLGRYRLDADRGGGYTHCFLARKATPVPADQRLHASDLEAKAVVRLPREVLAQHVLKGDFKDVKWTATVSLALLRLEYHAAAADVAREGH